MDKELFVNLAQTANQYIEELPDMPVGIQLSRDELSSRIDSILPEEGELPEKAIQALITGVEKGLVNSTNSRYFGFVIGGATPVSIAADWLTSVWDQSAQVYHTSPAAAIIEDVVVKWLLDLLSLPADAGVGFVTGAQMASFTALNVARNAVLEKYGWDVDINGIQNAPHINVFCGECCHGTIHSAIRMMGLGQKNIQTIPADEEGRMVLSGLKNALEDCTGPSIICTQAGNVNTGAFDPLKDIISLSKEHNAWVHVDGAFGLWANASPRLTHLASGIEGADSWAVDAHKWLNVPYDSGIVIIRDPKKHQELKTTRCAYAGTVNTKQRDGSQWVPENSRRSRGFVLYAALRNLGRKGVRQIIENCCDMAKEFETQFSELSYARVLNKVVLNQVLCRLEPETISDLDAFNTLIAEKIQQAGVCWMGTTQWQGKTALRISVSNWLTTKEDVRLSINNIRNLVDEELK